jgi:hypothetical protein
MLRSSLAGASLLIGLSICSASWGHPAAKMLRDVPKTSKALASVKSVTSKKIMTPDPAGNFNGNKPVTRYELAVTLDRFINFIEGSKKPLNPMKRKIIPSIPKHASAQVQKSLTRLVSEGFIDTNSPLLSENGNKPVTANELADAMSQVTIRLADRSTPPFTELQ